ncbi:MAG TPA: type II toxin-antitoxin system VapC family toxin [Thermodesulfovibrionales bacterium]|nr:type II toxin-antitoxin system VapC family toxin [Thermodesulfovibrionales bacterium]HVO64948.1 type II toxin-antitoxin system VapC family toxin [Syntrophales bacterium]
MPKYFLESSAFIKRYKSEIGSDVVNSLFNNNHDLFYLNLAIVEIRKVFYRLWKYPLHQDDQISENEYKALVSRFATDLLQMQRIVFTEEMIAQTDSILERVWVPNIFDFAQLSAYLIAKQEYPDMIFVCSDERSKLIDAVKQFVPTNDFIIPGRLAK